MNHYKTFHSLPAGLKPASVDGSGFARPAFFPEMLFISCAMAGEKAWKDTKLLKHLLRNEEQGSNLSVRN